MGRSSSSTTNHSIATRSDNPLEGLEQIILPSQGNQERIVYLSGDVNEHTISNVIMQLVTLANQSNGKPIHTFISTYGGSVDEMFSLYDTIKFLPCSVRTIGMGKIMSAGVLLLAAGEKGHRQIGRSARVMIHPISSGFAGNIFELQAEVAEAQRLQNLMVDRLSAETKMPPDQIRQLMKAGHDTYLTPTEAIKLGIADKLVGD